MKTISPLEKPLHNTEIVNTSKRGFESYLVRSSRKQNECTLSVPVRSFRSGKWRSLIEGTCANCQRPCLLKNKPNSRFCSRSCSTIFNNREKIGSLNSNWKGGISANHYHYKKLQMERYPERVQARKEVYSAIKSGKLVRGPCEACGDPKTDAHHDDYSKSLDVRWFCQKHHSQLHPRNAAKPTLEVMPNGNKNVSNESPRFNPEGSGVLPTSGGGL